MKNKRRLSRIRMKGIWIPNFIVKTRGIIHMRLGMIEREGSNFYIVKSPYLLIVKHRYLEYEKRIRRITSELISAIQKSLLEKESEREVLLERQRELKEKLMMLPEVPMTGNEMRAFLSLQTSIDKCVEDIAEVEAVIAKHNKEIAEIQEHEQLCTERMLEVAIAKSYVYIEGCQRALKKSSLYSRLEDREEELFHFIRETEVA